MLQSLWGPLKTHLKKSGDFQIGSRMLHGFWKKKSVKTNHHLETRKKKKSSCLSRKKPPTDRGDRFNHHHPHDFRPSVDWQMLHPQHPGYHPNALHETLQGRENRSRVTFRCFLPPVFCFFFETVKPQNDEKVQMSPAAMIQVIFM